MAKKRVGVKLPMWFPTTKSQESPWFICVQETCQIPLQRSWWGIQLCFRPHLDQRSVKEVMGLQSCESLNFRNFRTPNLGVLGQNDIWVLALWLGIENTIKGKVAASPKFGPWWILWVHVCPWFVRSPKML
jgi:hypothetical protein